jgi:uncharacterized damage-inducible protein DinB
MQRAMSVVLAMAFGAATLGAQAPSANAVSDAVRSDWNGIKQNVLKSAAVMPPDKYAFKPVANVRTYGQILAHIAGANYIFCAAARGEKSPHAEDAFEKSATTPPAIVKALRDSIDYCDAAYAALDDRRAVETIDGPFGGGKTARVAALMGNTGHLQEHYGNLVTYLRINGLVPPSSAQ